MLSTSNMLTVPAFGRTRSNSPGMNSDDDSNDSWMSDLSDHRSNNDGPTSDLAQNYASSLHDWITSLTERSGQGVHSPEHFADFVVMNSDITEGQELYAVPVINNTSATTGPNSFNFSTSMVMTEDYGDAYLQQLVRDGQNGKIDVQDDGSLRLPAVGLQSRVYIKHTNTIKGWGLFSAEPIPAGQVLTSYTGALLSSEEAAKRVGPVGTGQHIFHFYINTPDRKSCDKNGCHRLVVDANRYGNVARFVNHSCDSNLQPQNMLMHIGDLFVPQLLLVAKRDIQAHEELTATYVPTFRPQFRSLIKKCQCGTDRCIENGERCC